MAVVDWFQTWQCSRVVIHVRWIGKKTFQGVTIPEKCFAELGLYSGRRFQRRVDDTHRQANEIDIKRLIWTVQRPFRILRLGSARLRNINQSQGPALRADNPKSNAMLPSLSRVLARDVEGCKKNVGRILHSRGQKSEGKKEWPIKSFLRWLGIQVVLKRLPSNWTESKGHKVSSRR